jgi:xanthine dehydrogenase iron-sulfur cluster and FAD-binding subunit A
MPPYLVALVAVVVLFSALTPRHLELEKWFDPAFQDFSDNEIVRKTSPKQKM